MRKGGGKGKGAGFERQVCKHLSLWITQGKSSDEFWRSAMSGGRATLLARAGKKAANAAGDITATGKAGHLLTDHFYLECKNYANLHILNFVLSMGSGNLEKFWHETNVQSRVHDKAPMLIAKQNMLPTIVIAFQKDLLKRDYDDHWPPAPLLTVLDTGPSIWWFNDLFPLPKKGKPTLKRKA